MANTNVKENTLPAIKVTGFGKPQPLGKNGKPQKEINDMETITLTKLEKTYILDMLDVEAMRIQQNIDVDPITQIENQEELKMINAVCDRLQRTM